MPPRDPLGGFRQPGNQELCGKPLTLVRDDNGDFLPDLAATAVANQLVGIQPIAMNDRVAQSFQERQSDGGFFTCDAMSKSTARNPSANVGSNSRGS